MSDGFGLDDNHNDEAANNEEGEGGSEDIEKESILGDDSDEDIVVKGTTKRKAVTLEPEKGKKTSARKGKSIHVSTTPGSKKPKTGMEKISTIAAKEEETTQKVLDLKKLKAKGENDKALARIKAKADVKMQQMKLKAEIAQKKMDHEFQLQMARMGHFPTQPEVGPTTSSMGVGMFGGYSGQASTTPSISDPGLGNYDEFNFSNLT